MYDFNDANSIKAFKKGISTARKGKNMSQQELAEALNDNDRSRVANWESQKSKTVPKTQDIPTICEILGVEPNYLFGFSNISSEDDLAISEATHLSINNIKTLRDSIPISNFINNMLENSRFDQLMKQINRICINGFFSESLESTFSASAISKLEKAFHNFSREVFPIDMDVESFIPYVKKAFPWKEDTESIDEFVRSVVINPAYYEMLETNPIYQKQTMQERYMELISDFSRASFKHLMGNQVAELAEYEVTKIVSEIIKDHINTTVKEFKNRDRSFG